VTVAARGARRGWLAAALAGAAAACLGAGVHLLSEPARAAVADAGTVPGDERAAGGAVLPVPAVGATEVQAPPGRRELPPALPALALPPVGFRDPALRLRAPVVPVGTDAAGALELPDDTGTLGWWAGGAVPGASRGTVVLAGHLDTVQDGPGVMAAVVRQRVGAQLQLVDTGGGTTSYRVVAVRSYPKAALPAAIFAAAGPARLVLVTCGGTFDQESHHYSDNVVVYAVAMTP
jgi:Sortase domain